MRGLQSGVTKAATAVVVLVASFGLLVMHALPIPVPGTQMQAHAEQAASMTVSVASADSGIDEALPEMRGHQHGLLGCLWLVVAGLALLIAHVVTRLRTTQRHPVAAIRNALSSTQRAPPTSIRLSLVGISRR